MSRYRIGISRVPAGAWSTTVQVKPASTVHVSEQPSPLVVLPSSHASCGNFRPSPHTAEHVPPEHCGSSVQVGEQPSYGIRLPSSHCSKPSLTESPQVVLLQTETSLTWLHL